MQAGKRPLSLEELNEQFFVDLKRLDQDPSERVILNDFIDDIEQDIIRQLLQNALNADSASAADGTKINSFDLYKNPVPDFHDMPPALPLDIQLDKVSDIPSLSEGQPDTDLPLFCEESHKADYSDLTFTVDANADTDEQGTARFGDDTPIFSVSQDYDDGFKVDLSILESEVSYPSVDIKARKTKSIVKHQKKTLKIFSNILLGLVLAIILFFAFAFASSKSDDGSIFGYRFFNTFSSSMEGEYNKGDLVITQEVPFDTLEVGDVISYKPEPNEQLRVTNRVAIIDMDYDNTGERILRTMGNSSDVLDPYVVTGSLAPSKVTGRIPAIGDVVEWTGDNIKLIIVIVVLMIALAVLLRMLFKENEKIAQQSLNEE